jgi:mannose-6-phosphate isomerase-like protein (cupin superfamily)
MKAKVFRSAKVNEMVAAALAGGKSGATLIAQDEGLGYGLLLTEMKDRQPKPELHESADDVYYILAGKGALSTGGRIADPSQKSPGEWTGRTIDGAETIEVAAGDVVSIPRGTPHMMGCPGGAIRYFVVKVW